MNAYGNPNAIWMGDAALRDAMSRVSDRAPPASPTQPVARRGHAQRACRAALDVAVAVGLLLAGVVAASGGRALTPQAQMAAQGALPLVAAVSALPAPRHVPEVLPDVANDASVVVMVCHREDSLVPFWLCV